MKSEALDISRIEFLSVFSRGLDLAEGCGPGHAIRVAAIAALIARRMGLAFDAQHDVFLAGLLHDAGLPAVASETSVALSPTGLDDRALGARHSAYLDGEDPDDEIPETLRPSLSSVLDRHGPAGAEVARAFGLSASVQDAIRANHERASAADVPLGARIVAVAERIERARLRRGSASLDVAGLFADGSGRFDDEIVRAAASAYVENPAFREAIERREIAHLPMQMFHRTGDAPWIGVRAAAEVAASVVDRKSPYTRRHSSCVVRVALQLGRAIDLGEDRMAELELAAWLHDLGKLAIPNPILEKREDLTRFDWRVIGRHPVWTETILATNPRLARVAHFAGRHHERMDGNGYPHGLPGHRLNPECRILAVADVFAALCENRPHRKGVHATDALRMVRTMTRAALDPQLVDLLDAPEDIRCRIA